MKNYKIDFAANLREVLCIETARIVLNQFFKNTSDTSL